MFRSLSESDMALEDAQAFRILARNGVAQIFDEYLDFDRLLSVFAGYDAGNTNVLSREDMNTAMNDIGWKIDMFEMEVSCNS